MSGLVRVSVASGARRVDLVLPAAVPVAELVPELARSVGALDASTVFAGYRVVTQDGRHLDSDAGLASQGVEDGSLLTVTARVDDQPSRVHDDLVEAVAEAVERELEPWRPGTARRCALATGVLFLGLGGWALQLQHGSVSAAAVAGVVAALLVLGAVVLGRASPDEGQMAVGVAWVAVAFAALGGHLLVHGLDLFGTAGGAAGAGALVVGVVALLGLDRGRVLMTPAVMVGGVFVAAALVLHATGLDPARVLTAVLVLVVVASGALPSLALSAAGARIDMTAWTGPVDPLDPASIRADVLVGHQILLALTATVGCLLLLVAPYAVSLGLWGSLLAGAASAVLMLRARRHHSGSEVLVGLTAGVLGLGATAAALLVQHPDWRGPVAAITAASGAVLLAHGLRPSTPSVRRGQLGDLLETSCLVCLFPLLLLAVGGVEQLRW